MYQEYHLSDEEAMLIVEAVRDEMGRQKKRGIAIAVTDAQGELLAFLRTDDCKLPAITIAIDKAFSAARERRPSRAIGESSREQGFPMTNFGDLRYTAWGGGTPIYHQGQVVGAVGVSGLTEAEDMELSQYGAGQIS